MILADGSAGGAVSSIPACAGSAGAVELTCFPKKKHHVGAGNAVKFGDSGAAVTGYETSSATRYKEAADPAWIAAEGWGRRGGRSEARSQNNGRRGDPQSFEPKETMYVVPPSEQHLRSPF